MPGFYTVNELVRETHDEFRSINFGRRFGSNMQMENNKMHLISD